MNQYFGKNRIMRKVLQKIIKASHAVFDFAANNR
jgi:hypothetical protein